MPHFTTWDPFRNFQSPDGNGIIAILIGLLLPAVQKVREPARMRFVGADGAPLLEIPLSSQPTAPGIAATFLEIENVWDDTDIVHIVRERGSRRQWRFRTPDGVVTALLLPAVQRNGKPAQPIAGSLQALGDGSVRYLDHLHPEANTVFKGELAGIEPTFFAGPFGPGAVARAFGDGSVRFLLPAVQRAKAPFRVLFLDMMGNPIARTAVDGPASPAGVIGADFKIQFGDGSVRIGRVLADGSVRPVGEGAAPGNQVVAVALPAVQSTGQPILPLAGSVHYGACVAETGLGSVAR